MKIQVFIFLIFFMLSSCTQVETGAGQALDSANSVVESGSKKLWIPKNENNKEQDEFLNDYR
ncbi:MAG: hypothetical protein KDD56_00460 [Bdellovibrionales bacterium]|nr:hypothetical protein [Bdellovibrionales bacterium]